MTDQLTTPDALPAPLPDLCAHCKTRPATMNWVGEGSAMDYVHGNYTRWCDRCATEAQLAYARKIAAMIPELETKWQTVINE